MNTSVELYGDEELEWSTEWTRCGLGWCEGTAEDADVIAEYSNEYF